MGGRCVRYGWIGGQRNGWFAKVDNVFLRLGGFAKVDNRFGYEKWLQGGSIGFKLIIYHICIKTMSVKGGICAHEAYEAKK